MANNVTDLIQAVANSVTTPSYRSSGPTGRNKRQTDAELLSEVYGELRNLARHKMAGERIDHTLQATALVHEVYLRLVEGQAADWKNRAHFFAAAAHAMRRILVEQARKRSRLRHGGGRNRVDLEDAAAFVEDPSVDLIALEEALVRLSKHEERMSEIVTLRYFAGMTIEETAGMLGVSPRTVRREWDCARAWLYSALTRS